MNRELHDFLFDVAMMMTSRKDQNRDFTIAAGALMALGLAASSGKLKELCAHIDEFYNAHIGRPRSEICASFGEPR